MQYCFYSIGLYFHHQSHPQLVAVFLLVPSLYSFWNYFSTILQWHIGHLHTWGVHLSVSYLFSRQEYWSVCHSLLQWTTFCQNSPPWPIQLGWPYKAWLIVSLNETMLWSMWLDWLVSVIVVSVCLPSDALSQPLLSYWGFSYFGRGVSLHGCSSKV